MSCEFIILIHMEMEVGTPPERRIQTLFAKRKNFGLPKLATLPFMDLFSECHYFYFDVNRHFNCPNKCFETCCTYIPLNNLMNVCSSLFFGLRVGEEGTLVFSLLHLSNGGGRNR